jgi:hypothetical protein
MTSPFVNSVMNPIQLLVFLGAVVLVLGAVRRLPFMDVLSFFLWLFSYPVLALLALAGTSIAFGLFGQDYGLQFCLYPDGEWTKLVAAALVMMLFCEALALSYLWDHVEYESSAKARTRANVVLVRTRIMLYQWLVLRWVVSFFPQPDDDAWLRYLGRTEIDAMQRRPGVSTADLDVWPGRRLKATLAVVATQGLLLMGVIAGVTMLSVLKESWGHLGDWGNLTKIIVGLVCFTAGLPAGWLVSVAMTWFVVTLIPGSTQRDPATRQDDNVVHAGAPAPRRTAIALSAAALIYLVIAFVVPPVRAWFSLLFLTTLIGWLVWWLLTSVRPVGSAPRPRLRERVRELAMGASGSFNPHAVRDTLTLSDACAQPRVYAVSMVIAYLLSCVGVILTRSGNLSGGGRLGDDNRAFILGLIIALMLTGIFLLRTRLRAPNSVVAVPALIVQGFLVICVVYMLRGSAAPFRLVVALPLTCMIGSAIALFFFVAYLLPGRLAAGALGCLLVTAYMDGSAIDRGDSNQKLRFADLAAYYRRPIILDTRDYFTSSYGKVVRLDPRPQPSGSAARIEPVHIGSAFFEIDGDDLIVDLPLGYALPAKSPIVIRMPRRARIEYQRDSHSLRVLGAGPEAVGPKNLKNAALLWKNPRSNFYDSGGASRSGIDRYALFPLWPGEVATSLRDGTAYWKYFPDETAGDAWSIPLPKSRDWEEFVLAANTKSLNDVFLVGNWYFEDAQADPAAKTPTTARYRIPGAAADGFFPMLWHPGTGRANLGLHKPPLMEFDQQTDLEVTLTVPVPLGDYRVIKNEPEDPEDVVRVLISMSAEGMEPRQGDVLTFSPGGTIHGPYRVMSYHVASPVKAPLDPATGKRDAEDRPAALLIVQKDIKVPVPVDEAVTGPLDNSHRVSEKVARASEADPANIWERHHPHSSELADGLLDNIQVLHNWKEVLETLPEKTGHRVTCPSCPVVHVESCTRRAVTSGSDRPECACPVKHKLVLVTVSGGGIRSAVWATTVLRRLEVQFGASFPYHVRIITGASGGMVGATYYTGTLRAPALLKNDPAGPVVNPHTEPGPLEEFLGREDFLAPTASQMVFSDLPRALTLPLSLKKDRGQALEQAWQTLPNGDVFSRSFRGPTGFAAEEREGWRPSLVFTPMLVEDGRRLMISNLDLGFAPRNIGAMMLEPASSLLRPQVNQFGAFVDGGIEPGFDLYSLTAIEFFRLFPGATEFKVGTAARMSATFPFISPAVTLPTFPPRSVVDAGYYDNFGINLVSLWADLSSVKQWLVQNTSGVVIVQIRDHASQLLRTELDFELRAPDNPVTEYLMGADVAAVTGDAVHAVYDRGLLQLGRPLNGFFNSRYSITSFRNDEQIESLSNWFREVPPTSAEILSGVRSALDGALADSSAARHGATTFEAVGKAIPEAFQNRLARIKLEGRAFPYTTVVFECPIEAALSWELSHSESENIRKGMGFAVAPADTAVVPDAAAPLDYLERDRLLCEIRALYTEKHEHVRLAGPQLARVCFGVLHNRQRLSLLTKWWKESFPEPIRRPAVPAAPGGVK